MALFKPPASRHSPPRWRLALAVLLATALLLLPLRRQRIAACPEGERQPVLLAGEAASGGSQVLGLPAADAARAVAAAVARTSDVWWPTAGDTVHILYTSNGHP